MFTKIILGFNILFAFHLNIVKSQGDLVFVIDDTGSMADDIDQVKTEVDKLFDAAYSSNSSVVEEFLIVTFNDPGVKLRAKTKDREVFKKALNDINVNGGDDCPEMALTGIELALNESRPKSLMYVFTDADAKDHDKIEAIKVVAREKKDRLLFMLTGTCYDPTNNRTYLDLAEATEGQVFNLFKKEIGQMLEHARETISGGYVSRVPVVMDIPIAFEDTSKNRATTRFDIDASTKDILVSVSGSNPSAILLDTANGIELKTDIVTKTSGSVVLKLLDAKPGAYAVVVESDGPSSVVVNKKLIS